MKKLILVFTALFGLSFQTIAKDISDETLVATMMDLDLRLFENTFGNCKLAEVTELIGEDFEFYHDKVGATKGKDQFIEQLKNGNCSGKGDSNIYKAFRVLHEKTLKHFPLFKEDKLYAVLQTGVHSFYETNKGSNLTRGSTAQFSHLWELQNGKWKLVRVISYDHQSPEPWKH